MSSRDKDGAEDLVEAGHRNLAGTARRIAQHVPDGELAEFGPLLAIVSGAAMPPFNRIFVFEPSGIDHLEDALAWMSERELPFWVTVPESHAAVVEQRADDLALVPAGPPQPGMVISSLDDIPSAESPADIEAVTGGDDLAEFTDVLAEAFGLPASTIRAVHPETLLDDDDLSLFVGRIDDRTVACGQLVQTDEVAGVYSVGVTEDHRRQGIGKAMTVEALRTGRDCGCTLGVLQSSEMAYPLYESMGFEEVTSYHLFELET